MSEATQTTNGETAPTRKKRAPYTPVPKAAFFVVQIVDEGGEPMPFPKSRVKIIAVERNAEKVMELMEDGTHPHAFYLRGLVPPGTRAGSPNR